MAIQFNPGEAHAIYCSAVSREYAEAAVRAFKLHVFERDIAKRRKAFGSDLEGTRMAFDGAIAHKDILAWASETATDGHGTLMPSTDRF